MPHTTIFSQLSCMQMAPSQEEVKKLSAWLAAPGNALAGLSPPERFLAVMAEVPRLGAKSGVLLFCAQLPGLLDDARLALASLHLACVQVSMPVYCDPGLLGIAFFILSVMFLSRV